MTAAIYWYPDPDSGLETIALGEGLSDLQPIPQGLGTSERSLSGGVHPNPLGGYLRLRVVLENFVSDALYRKLMSLQRHLENGHAIGVASNSAKAWAGYADTEIARGQRLLITSGNAFYVDGASLSAGDEVVIESAHPEVHREWGVVSTVVAGRVRIETPGALYRHRATPILVRHEGFYPLLVMRDKAPIVTSDRRLFYTLDMTLETSAELDRAAGLLGGASFETGADGGTGKVTLDQIEKQSKIEDLLGGGSKGKARSLSGKLR